MSASENSPQSESEDSPQPTAPKPISWLKVVMAGIVSGLAWLIVAGVIWLKTAGFGPDGLGNVIALLAWPLYVWPWGLAGGIFGSVVWYLYARSPT